MQVCYLVRHVIAVCNAVFLLMISRCILEISAINSRSCRNFDALSPELFEGMPQNFSPNVINLATVEHVAKYGDDPRNDLGD